MAMVTAVKAVAPAGDASTHLPPLHVTLSLLHLPAGMSALHELSGIEVFLPNSDTSGPLRFAAIVSECTTSSLLLKSFYDANIRGKLFNKIRYILYPLAALGKSRCAFNTALGQMIGQPRSNDQTAPQFNVDGMSRIPFTHQGYPFSPQFLVCDHIFFRQEYETQFVAVLGLDFLREYFIRAQYNGKGWMIQLPPPCLVHISELPVFTDGCCLNNGNAFQDPEAKPARGGYGIHFPTLPNGWDMYGALASDTHHTNQKAELTAVIRALQIVRLREVSCEKISIFTDSKYAVQGFNDWIPNLWRSNGYLNAKKRVVVNADLFRSLDQEVSLWIKNGISVTLKHVPREQNGKADALSKQGAASSVPRVALNNPHKRANKEGGDGTTGKAEQGEKRGGSPGGKDSNGEDKGPGLIIGKNFMETTKPLVQWSPDGVYWATWQPNGSSGERLDC